MEKICRLGEDPTFPGNVLRLGLYLGTRNNVSGTDLDDPRVPRGPGDGVGTECRRKEVDGGPTLGPTVEFEELTRKRFSQGTRLRKVPRENGYFLFKFGSERTVRLEGFKELGAGGVVVSYVVSTKLCT